MRRTTFKILGTVCVGMGIAGAFLPVLPSTIFFILAAACYARSSPALEERILKHPVFGPPVLAWREHGAISTRSKMLALGGMTAGYIAFFLATKPEAWLAILIGFLMVICAIYVVTRPSGQSKHPAE